MCVCVCFIIVSKAKQPSLSFHPPPPPFPPPSLERQFPEPKPGNSASLGRAERQRGLWEEGKVDGGLGMGKGLREALYRHLCETTPQCADVCG